MKKNYGYNNQYQSKTIICIAHSNKVLEKFDNILSLNNGRHL